MSDLDYEQDWSCVQSYAAGKGCLSLANMQKTHNNWEKLEMMTTGDKKLALKDF